MLGCSCNALLGPRLTIWHAWALLDQGRELVLPRDHQCHRVPGVPSGLLTSISVCRQPPAYAGDRVTLILSPTSLQPVLGSCRLRLGLWELSFREMSANTSSLSSWDQNTASSYIIPAGRFCRGTTTTNNNNNSNSTRVREDSAVVTAVSCQQAC